MEYVIWELLIIYRICPNYVKFRGGNFLSKGEFEHPIFAGPKLGV